MDHGVAALAFPGLTDAVEILLKQMGSSFLLIKQQPFAGATYRYYSKIVIRGEFICSQTT